LDHAAISCFRVNDETWGYNCDPSRDTSDTRGLDTQWCDIHNVPSSAQVPDNTGTLGYGETQPVNAQYVCLPAMSNMYFSKGRSFRISRRKIGSGRAFFAAIQKARPVPYRNVPRCWDERFCQLERVQIAFGCCFCQGIPKLLFPSTTVTATLATNFPTPANATATFTEIVAATTAAPATSAATPSVDSASGVSDPTVAVAANNTLPSAGQKRKACL
jgi:hypothetical protein